MRRAIVLGMSVGAGLIAAALGTSVVFGLFPALHASRTDVRGMLTESAGTMSIF